MAKRKPKILTLDIELIGIRADSLWGTWDQNISIPEITEDWAIISAAAKWLGNERMFYKDQRKAKDIRDDRELVAWLCALLDEADVVIGQNIRRFDMRKIRARAVALGLKPFKEPKVIDTMEMAKGVGAFTSNKLEYLSERLTNTPKLKHANYPGKELWLALLRNEPAAWKECEAYNKRDVVATENVYLVLRPWAPRLPNLAQFYDDEHTRCPRCGSVNLQDYGTVTSNVSEYKQYVCTDCGGFSRSRFTINTKEKRRALLAT